MNAIPYALSAIIAAPFVGSFLALLAHRLPRGLAFAGGRSRCDGCGARLGIAELIPIVSWLWARGRCRHCGGDVCRCPPSRSGAWTLTRDAGDGHGGTVESA